MNKSIFLVAASLFLVTASVNLQVPLYLTYARAAGYGAGLLAVVFAAYVFGLLPVFIGIGGISDRFGRKSILLAGLACVTVATGAVMIAPNIHGLLAARFLQGIGVGLSVGTGTAYLAELFGGEEGATRAANWVAITTSTGFGCGPLSTDLSLLFHPSLTPWSYWALLVLLLSAFVGITLARAIPPLGGRLVRLPAYPHGTILMGFAIALAWAVTGIVITLVPDQLQHFGLSAWAPVALFLVNIAGAVVQPMARNLPGRQSVILGLVLLGVGTIILTAGAWRGLVVLLLLGAAVAGAACYGFIYLGGLATVSRLGGERRAGAVAGYYLFAYLGFGLPSIGTGYLSDEIGVLHTLFGFTAVVLLALFILVFLVKGRRGHSESATASEDLPYRL